MLEAKRKTLARTLLNHARIVATVIGGGRKRGAPSPLLAVEVGQTMAELAQQTLQVLVDEARAEGHTWQEIGDVLNTSRQAAYQRFGRSEDRGQG
jgi:hypothetical protein